MLYYSTLVSLNRPFIKLQFSKNTGSTDDSTPTGPTKICLESVERMTVIFRRFRAQYGLRNAPLAFVHGAIAAGNTILSLAAVQVGGSTNTNTIAIIPGLSDFESFLKDMQETWQIAGQMLERLRAARSSMVTGGTDATSWVPSLTVSHNHSQFQDPFPSLLDTDINFGVDQPVIWPGELLSWPLFLDSSFPAS